jgi:acyl-CoA synthetase (AMP-forming)/AMP-acid ligase II
LDARLLVTGDTTCRELEEREPDLARGRLLTPDQLAAQATLEVSPPRPEPDDVAFLQLTSGSTGRPRAVMIPHRGAVHNNLASDEAIGAPWGGLASTWAEAMVSWLPLHHDMGLVGCLLQSMTCGLDLWLFNPSTFLARPQLWLEELGRRGSTFAPAPNFGYHLCAQQVSEGVLDGVDLSGFRAAMVGAEMVRPETLAAFSRLTAESGFPASAFRPCYGLAEATLAVTFDVEGQGARTRPRPEGAGDGIGSSEVVSVGRPIAGTKILIAAPDGSRRPDGEVGEVRVQGPGVFAGYYRDEAATAENLRDGWLLTGDLGFLHDGELYLTGRSKDLLILHGHNVMPHELEWAAESAAGGGGSERSGSFSVDSPEGEVAVVVVETREREPEGLGALERRVRLEVARALSLPLADVVLVRRGRIPKTTSGKVQRRELRRRYLDGELERLLPQGGQGED